MPYTHNINAEKMILRMGKGARRTWRLLGLPESLEAQRSRIRNYWSPPGPRATRRRLRAMGISGTFGVREWDIIEAAPFEDLPEAEEEYELPGLYDHLKD